MADVVIFGTGQISDVVRFYLERDTSHRIRAYTTDAGFIEATEHNGLPIWPFETLERYAPPGEVSLILPISYKGVNSLRRDRYLDAKQRGYSFISYISPRASYYDTPVGENSIIFENNTLQPFCKIGNNVILWSGNHIGHHAQIGDHCFLASQIVISGAVTVGEQTFIGVNACVHDNVIIGRECIVAAGAIVARNLPDYSVLRPARSQTADIKSYDIKGF